MRTIDIALIAGTSHKLSVMGYYLTLLEAAAPVDMEIEFVGKAGNPDIGRGVREGYGENFPEMTNSVTITSATDQVIKVAYGLGQIKMDRSTIVAAQAAASDNIEPVTLGTSAALALSGGATRRRLILTAHRDNAGAIALGGPALTTANAARWLEAGESYIETDAAPAAVYALAETAGDLLCIEVA